MGATIIDGNKIADEILAEVAKHVEELPAPPCLWVVLVGDDPASLCYVKKKEEACRRVKIDSKVVKVHPQVRTEELLNIIDMLNDSPDCHGILVQLPLPPQVGRLSVLNAVAQFKDVDGFHCANVGRLAQTSPLFVPCTPLGIMEILERYDIGVKGKHAVVINDSLVVGRPLFNLLVNEGATVTMCHRFSNNIGDITRRADIVISAVGRGGAFRVFKSDIKVGATVIDVGFFKVGNKVIGDVESDVNEVAGYMSPPVGGVGPVTVAMLMKNTLRAAEMYFAA